MFSPELHQRINSVMISRPSYYSGRGATTTDLNGPTLKRLYDLLTGPTFPKRAKGAFIRMVEKLPVLSASDFFIAFARLEGNDWRWKQSLTDGLTGTTMVGADNHQEASMIVFAVLTSRRSPEQDRQTTRLIRDEFLRAIGRQPPARWDTPAQFYCQCRYDRMGFQ